MTHVTELIEAAQRGEQQAVNELLPIVYSELRKLASLRLSQESAGQTLQPTALVHETYLRLLGPVDGDSPLFANKRHFFAAAAEAMRRILIEKARAKASLKRGRDQKRIDFDLSQLSAMDEEQSDVMLTLDEALTLLEASDSLSAQLVKLRFYGGLTHQQAAESLGLTRREADRVWALARAWMYRQIKSTL